MLRVRADINLFNQNCNYSPNKYKITSISLIFKTFEVLVLVLILTCRFIFLGLNYLAFTIKNAIPLRTLWIKVSLALASMWQKFPTSHRIKGQDLSWRSKTYLCFLLAKTRKRRAKWCAKLDDMLINYPTTFLKCIPILMLNAFGSFFTEYTRRESIAIRNSKWCGQKPSLIDVNFRLRQ